MAKKQKIIYDTVIDMKASFEQYNYLNSLDNTGNIKSQCVVLQRIIKEQLTSKQRQTLQLYYQYNLTVSEISKKIGKNKSTVSRSLNSAKNKIKDYMQYNNFRQ